MRISILLGFISVVFVSSNLQAQNIEAIKATDLVNQYQATEGVVVVNFWSTWCKPCIDEIPHFLEVFEQLKPDGVKLWLVSQDTDDLYKTGKLKKYIAEKKWDKARLFWFDETNADYYCPIIDSTWSGVIPSTLIYHKEKNYYKFIEEPLTRETLEAEIRKAL